MAKAKQTRMNRFLKKVVNSTKETFTPRDFQAIVKEGSDRKSRAAVISTQLSVMKRAGLLRRVDRATYEPTTAAFNAYDRAFA